MSAATIPAHVREFNANGGERKYGGLHFDDPEFDGHTEARGQYGENARKYDAPENGNGSGTGIGTGTVTSTKRDLTNGASLKQRLFMLALSYQKDLQDVEREIVRSAALREKTSKHEASNVIDNVISRPYRKDVFVGKLPQEITDLDEADAWFQNRIASLKVEKEQVVEAAQAEIPEGLVTGYYSVNEKRYHISVPTKGNWVGWIFFATGSDYYERQKLGSVKPGGSYQGKAQEAFEAILADPLEAMKAYGRITSSCGKCGRKLEDEASREAGIGPVCAESF